MQSVMRVGELLDESVVVAKESNDAARGYAILKQREEMGPE